MPKNPHLGGVVAEGLTTIEGGLPVQRQRIVDVGAHAHPRQCSPQAIARPTRDRVLMIDASLRAGRKHNSAVFADLLQRLVIAPGEGHAPPIVFIEVAQKNSENRGLQLVEARIEAIFDTNALRIEAIEARPAHPLRRCLGPRCDAAAIAKATRIFVG